MSSGSGDVFRRPGSTKGSSSQPLYALGKNNRVQPRLSQLPSAAALFGNDLPSSSTVAGSFVPPQRKPAPSFALSASAGAAASRLQPLQSSKDILKRNKLEAVAPRPSPAQSTFFQRAQSSIVAKEPSQKADTVEWVKHAVETDGRSLSSAVKMAVAGDASISETQIRPLICGAVRNLVQNRVKDFDDLLVVSLARLATVKPEYFRNEIVLSALMSLVKRDAVLNNPTTFNNKSNRTVMNCIVGTSLLYSVLNGAQKWPAQILKIYLEDAAGDRQWVDLAECRELVRAVRYTFSTKAPTLSNPSLTEQADLETNRKLNQSPRHLSLDEVEKSGRQSPNMIVLHSTSSPSVSVAEDSMSDSNMSGNPMSVKDQRSPRVDRFEYLQKEVPELVMEVVRDAVKRGSDGGKNLGRLLITTAGVSAARSFAMPRIEQWLQNNKTASVAMNLMATVCANCVGTTDDDVTIISQFLKLRPKSKPQQDTYFASLNELFERNPDNLYTVLRLTLESELNDLAMAKRSGWNLQVMAQAVKLKPVEASAMLGNIYATCIISSPDDSSRSLKTILFDLVKINKADLRPERFINVLLTGRTFSNSAALTQLRSDGQGTHDKKVMMVLDIVLAAQLLMMITRFKDDMAMGNSDAFVRAITPLQSVTLDFLRNTGKKYFSPSQETIRQAFRKIYFLDKPQTFQLMDKGPTDHERMLFFKVAARIPITPGTFWQIVVQLGASDSSVLTEMIEALLTRALTLKSEEHSILHIDELGVDLIDALFNMGVFRAPETATFPPKYRPPQLIRKDVYWQCWKLLVMLAAADPGRLGNLVWTKYPTGRALMQMLIINRFDFPPESMTSAEKDKRHFTELEQKLAEEEKKSIVEFENRLAGGTAKTVVVSEAAAKLPKDYMRYDLVGPFRQPPDSFLGALERLNKNLELGKLISGCRVPDFLLELLNEKGTAASLPWLLELTTSSKSMFDVLPVDSVCEMLCNSLLKKPAGSSDKREQDFQKCRNLVMRLSDSIIGENTDAGNVGKTFTFFSERLCKTDLIERENALLALEICFNPEKIESSLGSLWKLDKRPLMSEVAAERPVIELKSKHGISIEHVLLGRRPDAWCPGILGYRSSPRVSYAVKFHWLLVDIRRRCAHFPTLKEKMCLQFAKALEIECEASTVCAYLEFIATYLKSTELPLIGDVEAYLIIQVISLLIVEKKDLRNAVFLGRNGIILEEDVQRIRTYIVALYETFLLSACKVNAEHLCSWKAAGLIEDELIQVRVSLDEDTHCPAYLTLTTARAFPVLMALVQDSERYGTGILRKFCLNTVTMFTTKNLLTNAPVEILSLAVRKTILLHSLDPAFVDIAVTNMPLDYVFLEFLCCDNIPLLTLRKMIEMVDLSDVTLLATLKYVINSHMLVCEALLDFRLTKGLPLTDPVHQTMKAVLDSVQNPFSEAFTT